METLMPIFAFVSFLAGIFIGGLFFAWVASKIYSKKILCLIIASIFLYSFFVLNLFKVNNIAELPKILFFLFLFGVIIGYPFYCKPPNLHKISDELHLLIKK